MSLDTLANVKLRLGITASADDTRLPARHVGVWDAAAYAKNGADIRLAVDAVEDMFRLPDLTHMVIVAGDSDYIALAQRCRRLGRYVVGVGVAGSTSRSLAAACDELVTYDALPGITPAGARESHVHDVTITRESPNYTQIEQGLYLGGRGDEMIRF